MSIFSIDTLTAASWSTATINTMAPVSQTCTPNQNAVRNHSGPVRHSMTISCAACET